MFTINAAQISSNAGFRISSCVAALLCLGGHAASAADTTTIPPIPAIIVPDFIGTEPAQQKFEDALGEKLADIDGVRISPARCDAAGGLVPILGLPMQDDAGMTANFGEDGVYVIEGGGAGTADLGDAQFTVEEDGSGTINRSGGADDVGEQISVEADGSGSYNGPGTQITLDGQGGGTLNSTTLGQISIETDGSGTWNGPLGQITNDGQGGGTWTGSQRIINNGDGTGFVDRQEVKMEPLPPVPPAGRFPLLSKFRAPPAPCGYIITLEDRILFDFDKDVLRPDATETVDALAKAFIEVRPDRLEIRGHTDSKGSDDYNQDLSERRARTVQHALQDSSVSSAMGAAGFGESQAVAPNEINGEDNPAGRQLNRRVEIFVPGS